MAISRDRIFSITGQNDDDDEKIQRGVSKDRALELFSKPIEKPSQVAAEEQKPISQDQEKPKGFLSSVKQAAENLWVGVKALPSQIKAGAGTIPDKIVESTSFKVLTVDNQTATLENIASWLEKDLKEGKVRLPKSTFWGGAISGWEERELTPQEREKKQKSLDEVNARLGRLRSVKEERENNPDLARKWKEESVEASKKAQEDRQKILDKYGTPDKWSGQWIANEVAYNVPQFIGSFGLGLTVGLVTKNPQAALAIGFSSSYVQESGGAYQEARSQGLNDSDAQKIAGNVGVINAMIEQIPLGRILTKSPAGKQINKNVLRRVTSFLVERVKDGTFEGGTESIQEIVNNAYAMEYDENRELFDNVPEAALIGGILGGAGGAVGDYSQQGNINVIDPDVVDTAEKAIEEAIATPKGSRTPEQEELAKSVEIENDVTEEQKPEEAPSEEVVEERKTQAVIEGAIETGVEKLVVEELTNAGDSNISIKRDAGDNGMMLTSDKMKNINLTETRDKIQIQGFERADYEQGKPSEFKGVPTQILNKIEQYALDNNKSVQVIGIGGYSKAFWEKQGYDVIGTRAIKTAQDLQKPTTEFPVVKGETVVKTVQKPITSVNPTGSVFVDYSPETRAKAPLGNNITTLAKTQGKSPNTVITIYRGTVSSQEDIVAGDFITTNRELAKAYGEKVISKQVKLGDILDDIESPLGEEYLYRPNASEELKYIKYDYTKSEWYKNYTDYLTKNKDKFNTLEEWLNSNKASGKSKLQLTDIWNKVNKPAPKKITKTAQKKEKAPPVIQKPIGRGKKKVSTLGLGVEAKAVAKELVKGFADIPDYQQLSVRSQSARAEKLVQEDFDKALAIATGQEDPPYGLLPESVYVAVENKALADGSVNILRQLATSPRVSEDTALGQRIRMLAERNPDSAVNKIKELANARRKALEERRGTTVQKEAAKIKQSVDKEVKSITKGDWVAFINSIEC